MARGRAACRGTRGGEGIQARRPYVSSVVAGLAALALAAALAAHAALRLDGDAAGGVALAGAAVLALLGGGLVVAWAPAVTVALVGLGGTYVLSLALDAGVVDRAAAIYAVTFLLAAELAYWSLEVRAAGVSAALAVRRAFVLGLLALSALAVASVVLAASGADVEGGLVLLVGGVLSAVAALALVWALASRARRIPSVE